MMSQPPPHAHTRMQTVLDASDLDAVVVISPENTLYLSNANILTQRYIPDRLAAVIWSKNRPPTMVVCTIEESLTRQDSTIPDICTYVEFATSPVAVIADVVRQHGVASGRVGYERKAWNLDYWGELTTALPDTAWIPAESLLDHARMIKGADEIRILSDAARATDAAIHTAFMRGAVGWSEKQIGDVIQTEMLAAGADFCPFLVLAAGENTKRIHHFPNHDPMPRGGIVHFDGGGSWQGYYSDMARTAVVGDATAAQRDIYARLWEVQQEIIAMLRVGERACDIYTRGAAVYPKYDLPFGMPLLGHSLGVVLHEYPIINRVTDEPLQPGMLFCIEPASMTAGGDQYHIEDLVLVTESGPQIVSRAADWSQLPVIGGMRGAL